MDRLSQFHWSRINCISLLETSIRVSFCSTDFYAASPPAARTIHINIHIFIFTYLFLLLFLSFVSFVFFSYYPQPGRDASGAAIALFTANLHNPKAVTHRTTLQGVVYQLDIALQNSDTQKAGLVFIYDMSSSKYSNFDYDLSQKILTLLKVSIRHNTSTTVVYCYFYSVHIMLLPIQPSMMWS